MGMGMFDFMFTLVFVMCFATFGVTIFRMVTQWNKNNHSPRLTVPVTVVAKRMNVDRHRHNTGVNNVHHTSTSTTYYVTFQVASGDRMELQLPGYEFGMIVEGDRGNLTFQGTRFLSFERT